MSQKCGFEPIRFKAQTIKQKEGVAPNFRRRFPVSQVMTCHEFP
ncbi:hypothetical protein BH23PLA1_BH23PLA1_35540 [soil metagenome]